MTWLPSLPEDATVRDVLALDPEVGVALVDLHHAIHVAAFYAYMNRLVSGHGVEGSPEVWAERGRALHEARYEPLRRWLGEAAGTGDAG